MNNIYDLRLQDILKTTSGTRQFAENSLMAKYVLRVAMLLLLCANVFSHAQADVTIQGVNYTEIDGKITVDGTEYEVWQGDYDEPANGTRIPSQLQLRNYFSGSGTQADPYIIDTAKKFATLGYLSAYVFTGSNYYGYFKLTKNICLAKYQWSFGQARSQSFQATLDGDGHTIIGLFLHAVSSDTAGGGQYRYGLFSCTKGASDANRAVVKNLTVSKPTLYVEGTHTSNDHFYGILVGRVQEWSTIENVKVVDPLIDVRVSQKSNWYMSTGLAYCAQNNGMRVNNIVVKNPKVKSYGSLTYRTANSNVRFFFGGAVGYIYSNNNDAARVSIANNCTVTGADIDFRAFAPEVVGNYARNLFMVGGVIGVSADPHKYPENLYFSGKIFAPFAVVAPCLVSSKDNDPRFDAVINYYSGEAEGNTDEVERSASSSWHYGEYKIGVYGDLASPTQEGGTDNYYIGSGTTKRYVNYKASDVEDIDGTNYIDANKLVRHNRYKGTPRRSSTVIWWTENNNGNTDNKESTRPTSLSDWREGEQYLFPEYQKNLTAFPWYYLYYAQGVNRDTKSLSTDGGASSVAAKYETAAEKNVENAMGKSGAKNITLTLTDNDKGQRGFDAHSFSVAATGDDAGEISSYQWYVDGVAQGTGNSISVKPGFNKTQGYQNGTSVIVQALDGSDNILAQAVSYLPVPRLRFKGSDTAGTKTDGVHEYVYDAGTKEHPYLLGCESDLRLLSEQMKQPSNLRQEYIHFSNGLNSGNKCYYRSQTQNIASNNPIGYGQAYYELDSNIDFSADSDDSPFEPIGPNSTVPYSNDGTNGNYNNNFAFVGSVDGKGFTIKNLRETWYAGYANNNGAPTLWGLFSCVGSTTNYYKVGEELPTVAAVRNLIIENALFTHKTSNTSFYYNNGSASSVSNHCYIGPLTGIAGNNSVIENISVVNSKITDEGSSTYSLGTRRLSIGGVIGRATAAITSDNSTMSNAKLRYLSSNTDIDIQYAEFANTGNATQVQTFNIGGIVGSIHSNDVVNTVPYPRPSFYSGRVRARNAFVGPLFGYVSYSGNTDYGWNGFPSHFTGKTAAANDFDASDMYFSNYRIYTESTKKNASGANYVAGYKQITTSYPSVVTDWGDRNIKEVTSHPLSKSATTANYNVDSDTYEYQGVNQGNYKETLDPTVIASFNDYSSLLTDDQKLLQDYKWAWSSSEGNPVVTIGEVSGLYVSVKDTYDGKTIKNHELVATVNSASSAPRTYQWYKKVRVAGVDTDEPISEATESTYTAIPNIHNQYIFVRATIGDESSDSEVVLIPKTDNFKAKADKEEGEAPVKWIMKAFLSLDPTDTETTATTTASLVEEGYEITYQWYKGSVAEAHKSNETGAQTANLSVESEETTMRHCVIKIVDKTIHSTYEEANTWLLTVGKLPANVMVVYLDPSNTSNNAADDNTEGRGLSKEKPVLSWHKAYSLLVNNVTWEDNVIVLMSESNGDRTYEGFMFENSLRGGNTGNYSTWYTNTWTNSESTTGMQNMHMWKNVTITGKWENDDFSSTGTKTAKITFNGTKENGMGIFGDTRFQHLTFNGRGSGYCLFYCQYHSLEMGDGIVMSHMEDDGAYGKVKGAHDADFQIFGGFLNDQRFKNTTSGFDYAKMQEVMPHGIDGFTIDIKSGHYSVICSSHRQNTDNSSGQGIIGTPNMPVKCTINVDINRDFNDNKKACIDNSNSTNADYDIGLILAGNHEGSMYGDVDINVYSGHVGRIASGTLGAVRITDANWWTGHYLPLNAFMGRANVLLDPSASKHVSIGETDEVKNSRVIVTELYGGGVGRALSKTGMITIPFLGHNSVTVNGGTFKLLPASNTNTDLFPGIYATGAGGVNGVYHDDTETIGDGTLERSYQRLPFWVDDKDGQVDYGPWSVYKNKTGDKKVYIKCYDGFDIVGDTIKYTLIDPEDAQTVITINDGVFGSKTKPIDGIYGGGSGYTPEVWMKNSDASWPNYRSGNIYGKEGADHPATTLTINGGDFYLKNGVFAGGRGTDYYYKTSRHDGASGDSSNHEWYGNYTGLGQIFGDVELNITGGHFHHDTTNNPALYKGNVYGAGLGVGKVRYNNQPATEQDLVDMARIYGTTTVNISGGTIEGNVYGGGAMGDVGYGTSTREGATYEIGAKNAVTLNITGGTIDGDIYGGAMKSDVYGNAVSNVNGAAIGGDIYGGGHGELDGETVTASADISGNTTVTLGSSATYSNETAHFLYGGGNLASVIGIYTKDGEDNVTGVTSGGNTTVNVHNGMGTAQLSVYGAGLGTNTACNTTNVTIYNFATTSANKPVIGLKDVFGGGNRGLVYTRTNVFMSGGQVLGNVFGGGDLAAVGSLAPSSYPYGDYGTLVSLASPDALVYGNIYGGGNKAAVSGVAQVNLGFGQFAGEVFGGGKGEMDENDDNTVVARADINGQTRVFINGAKTIWDKLWDNSNKEFVEWNGKLSAGKTIWEKFINNDGDYPVFLNTHNIYGGGYLACTVSDTARVEVTNGVVPANLIKLDVWKNSFRDNANPHFYVFGGGFGPFTQVANTDVTVGVEGYFSDDEDESTGEQWALDIPLEGENRTTDVDHEHDGGMSIYGNNYGIGGYTVLGIIGGGYAGLVKNDTNVKLGGTTFVHRVYGGGYGHLASFENLASGTNITAGIAGYEGDAGRRTRDNLGEVGGDTKVLVSLSEPDAAGRTGGVYGDVFGGGAGVESAEISSTLTDFPDMGKVLGTTRVDVVENARIHGNVYGGGDVANVANTFESVDSVTVVKVRGGDVFGSVFGGGKGRIAAKCADSPGYTALGNVAGNAYVIVRDSLASETIDEEVISRTISPNVWGDIYGGGEVGDINKTGETRGNSDVIIEGGNIGGNVFGAGFGNIDDDDNKSSADIMGNSVVRIDGGSFLWNKAAGLDGNVKTLTEASIAKETALAIIEARRNGEESAELKALRTNFADIFDLDNNLFKNDHNIYGGGSTVSTVYGNATITVNHGMVTDEVDYYDDDNWKLSSVLKQLCTSNNSHPQFSVLGGGYGINTTIKNNTSVTVQVGKDIDGDPATVDYPKQAEDLATWSDLYDTFASEYSSMSSDEKDEYYGGTSGANGLKRYEASRLANIFRIPHHTFMNIIGGGMAGIVEGNTEVTLTNQSLCQNVFGGGIGIMPDSPVGTEEYGQVYGTTQVKILGGIIKGNVYGGGAGMESYKKGDGTYIDFPEMGAVRKTTSVLIDGSPSGTIVFGKVFGGGDIADVENRDPEGVTVEKPYGATPATDVTIQGGCVYQQVFAGGSGVLKANANDYTKLGEVNGDTRVTIKDNPTNSPANDPWLWNRVYGGGSYGSVDGATYVKIEGGHLGYNIFGAGLGDLGDGTAETVTTSYVGKADAPQNTNINITGGEWCLSQMWDIEKRNWVPKKTNDVSAQFDKAAKKFLINHNMYGGGHNASVVTGNSNITINKGMLKEDTALGHDYGVGENLFSSTEWKEVYNKTGSFHFCVIGGGYGEHTKVSGNTNVNVNIDGSAEGMSGVITESFIEESADILKADMYKLFLSKQSMMDIIGGGYNGEVEGDTYVTISGDPYIRRIFGGSFYADVNNTHVKINSACADYIFGGGMMGDVKGTTEVIIGNTDAATNSKILLCGDVYGGNDVSGQVNGLVTVDICGGKIYNNVYGAGNGNYLYALNEDRAKVAAVEGYLAQGAVYDLVYEVPRRHELMQGSAESSSEAARLVNINSYRPLAQFIDLKIAGTESYPVKVVGKVFGGGNTATVTKLNASNPTVTVDIGNYVNAKEVYMGADGEAMFDESTSGFLNAFKRINNIVLSDGINWASDPYNSAIPETYLPLDLDGRQKTFPHIIDLYFQPVEMSIQPTLKWNGTVADPDTWDGSIRGTTIGSFFCGGNRGNMDVVPNSGGNVVDYIFPEGLRITDKIVGGCNNANFTRTDLNVVHEGGYLLGSRKTTDPMIRLTVKANMTPTLNGETDTYTGGNVYGGCYKSGSIHGDVSVNVLSNMINGLDVDKLAATNAAGTTVASVYGAGYGTDSYVYGDINVTLGSKDVLNTQDTSTSGSLDALNIPLEGEAGGSKVTAVTTTYNDAGSSVNNLYGGGELGNVIGNTTVNLLNGHVVTDVVGGSYSGTLYGSTQVLVGYPEYYTVKPEKSGTYNLKRADTSNLAVENEDGSKAIKQEIRLIAGDIISPVVYDAIKDYDTAHGTSQYDNFTHSTPSVDWSKINITIGEAVYGGGYALSSGYSGTGSGAGTYTVKKFNETYNVDNSMLSTDPLYNKPTKGYGGNTTVLAWENDYSSTGPEHEHITISSESADGGFYGDGHLSYAEGFRSGELRGYGYANHSVLNEAKYKEKKDPEGADEESNWKKTEVNNAKMINTIQRLDLLRLTDNCLILNGARDYTINEVSTTPYSIARVGELQMVSSIDKNTTLPTNPTTVKYRNYLGLINNIHYVGAIKSDALFGDAYHAANGTIEDAEISYKEKKAAIITTWYAALDAAGGDKSVVNSDDQTAWWKRNDATAKNLIGISSGFAFKVQNTYTANAVGTENIFYGPIDGVVEMKLILPISEEGGGYVYADNVHDDPTNFLETTGNFVFPIEEEGAAAHYVVDDCLQINFDDLPGNHDEEGKNAQSSEIHYWFLIGSNYVYNLHITGYTYNSEPADKHITFHADTSDGLTVLEGATNDLKITEVTWKHYGKKFGEEEPNSLYDDDILNSSKAYTLKLSASYSTYTDENEVTHVKTEYNEDAAKSLYATIARGSNTTSDQEMNYVGKGSDGVIPEFTSSPKLAIALDDFVDNSVTGYYEDHLARPDTVKIVLASGDGYIKTYTINLIINYVKGPSYTGNITVSNCALPGEYIKIDKTDLVIDSDESFAQNGEFLRIGKLNDGGTALVADSYITYDASGETTSEMLKGKVYFDPAGNYLLIPAYYFMNGYGVQYVFTCNNMDNAEFAVDMTSANKLLVHNYHQMKPRATFPVDLHLAEAVTRASVDENFAEPRIYIKDIEDLQAMQQWVDTVGVNDGYTTVNYDGVERTIPQGGQYAQFFLQNNITMQQTTPLQTGDYVKSMDRFAGTFNGDGYTIKGVDTNLFTELTGKVYNLGLESGSIAGTVEDEGKIRTSFEYANLKAYDMDGNAKDYTVEDFNSGKVAYNLNQYYLEARKYLLDGGTKASLHSQTAVDYVKNYYANGDYQYARQGRDARGNDTYSDGDEYLRYDAHPHYTVDVQSGFDTYETFHNIEHPIDAARSLDVDVPNSFAVPIADEVSTAAQMALNVGIEGTKATAVAPGTAKYAPLYDAEKNDVDAETTVVKNDYIFFGQNLQATPEEYPSAIASHNVADMTNRVYRASGFYQSKVDEGYHFNASGDANRIASYVHNTKTTAIDFTGKRDEDNSGETPGADHWLDVATQKIFYAPALDLPAQYYALRMADGVTKNLLVYTDNQTSVDNQIAKIAATTLGYGDDTDESKIDGHHVIGTGTPIDTYTAAKLHLVDMEDFNAPVQFTADRAWYIRDPQAETGYVNEAGRGWTSISLPFTVKNATLSEGLTRYKDAFNNGQTGSQTSITYFYGATDNPSDVNVRKRTVLGHEFWFRALNSTKDVAGDKAYFKRPLYGIDGRSEASDAANAANRSFEAYKPYIVSFPGEQFYEFDMTGQTIAFAADDAVIAVTDDNVTANRAASKNSYYYYGAYLNNDGKDGAYAIDVNGTGDRFDNGQHIYPFRGYLTTGAEIKGNSMDFAFSGDSSNRYILIGDDLGKLEEVLDGDIDKDPDGGVTTQSGLRVYGVGTRIVVVSDYATTLPVYTSTGALVRVLDVRPGTASYSGFKQGIYIVDQKKLRLR